jgi:hypothetical protein
MVAAVPFRQIADHDDLNQSAPANYQSDSEDTSPSPDISPYSLCEPMQVEVVSARAPKEIDRPT